MTQGDLFPSAPLGYHVPWICTLSKVSNRSFCALGGSLRPTDGNRASASAASSLGARRPNGNRRITVPPGRERWSVSRFDYRLFRREGQAPARLAKYWEGEWTGPGKGASPPGSTRPGSVRWRERLLESR